MYTVDFRKPALLNGVYAMGFNAPSKIQETALPTLLADPYVHFQVLFLVSVVISLVFNYGIKFFGIIV